jgi:hypothetical protein
MMERIPEVLAQLQGTYMLIVVSTAAGNVNVNCGAFMNALVNPLLVSESYLKYFIKL